MTGFDERRISIHHAVSGMNATALGTRISGLDVETFRRFGATDIASRYLAGTWLAE
jgi:hypothetical protein